MDIGFYAAALGATQEEKRLNVIANNLANVTTPGYKKDSVQFKDFVYETTTINMDQGAIQPTGNLLDIAISGSGFLRVQTDQGIQYTRAGNLRINKDNTLVTQQGWPVLGESGPISVTRSDIRIGKDGQVFDEDSAVDTLSVVRLSPDAVLQKVGNSCLKLADGEPPPEPADNYTIEQGSLEEANLNVVQEMALMIESTRSYEAYQKVVQLYQQEDSQITTKLGSA
ncbi:MAG: flagellar hook-basal body protein [Syntrophobacteraceae bacterium]